MSMKRLYVGLGLAAVLAVPSVAGAQAQAEPKFFVKPIIGAVAGAGPGASFSGAVSFKAGEKLQIAAELGRMNNILPSSVADDVEKAAALVANSINGKHSASSSADANYFMVTGRWALRDVSGAHTFLEIGAGAAHVESTVSAVVRGSESLQGDISSQVITPFTSATPATKPMFSIGGGIVLGVTRATAIEVGARYQHIATDHTAIKMANIFGAFRIGF
jgi:opacity protein-like surface antigen